MSISLANGAATIQLHPDLKWSDEYNWKPVEQTAERTITGALVVSSYALSAGRSITLEPEDDGSAWMTRDVVEQLRNWAAVAGLQMTLTLRGESRTVIFRHQDGAALEAVPVVHFSDSDIAPEDFYRCTLRFMEI